MTEFNYARQAFATVGDIVQAQVDEGKLPGTVTVTLDNGVLRMTVEGLVDVDDYLEDYTSETVLTPSGGILTDARSA